MNFSQKEVRRRMKRTRSSSIKNLNKIKVTFICLLFVSFLFAVCFGISMIVGAFQSTVASAPSIDSIQLTPQGYTTTLVDTSGSTIQTLVGKDANRQYVTLEQIPANLQNAFIAIEDERFYSHEGVDFQGVLRAFVIGLTNGGHFNQGASTLTQQLLKNQVFEGGEEQTYLARFQRKLQEQYLAIQLEKQYSKQQILEYYLNTINLGQNTLGVQAAAKRYFNKSVDALTLSECAVLAGITQNPTAYNPITHPTTNSKKRTTVLTYMKEQGFITTEDYNTAINDDVYSRIQTINEGQKSISRTTSYFTDALISQVIKDLKQKLGYTETQAYNALYSRGLTIQTTLDTTMQKTCDSIINNPKYYPKDSAYKLNYQLTVKKANGSEISYDFASLKQWTKEHKKKDIKPYFKKKSQADKYIAAFKKAVTPKGTTIIAENIEFTLQPQVSFVLMDQKTGEVKAICGGRGDKTASRTLNRASDSARQPGSTFKVLSTFLPALDTAGLTLASVQDDTKFTYPGTKQEVKNWYGSYRGLSSVRSAIKDSMNVVTVKTLNDITPKLGYDYLLNLGFSTLVDSYVDRNGNTYTDIALPMALGGLTKGVTNLELTNAFASIANGGTYHTPTFYSVIYDHDGNILLKNDNSGKQVMKDSTAWLLTSAMEDVVNSGTGKKAKFKKVPMSQAGKSGTTTENKDLWYVGYTPYLTAGIWSGNDDSTNLSKVGYHKDMWRDIMEALNKKYANVKFAKPKNITSVNICTKCGKLAIEGLCNNAKGGSCIKKEYFDKENVPSENCDCHIKCKICRKSGRLANDRCPSDNVYTVIYLQKKETAKTSDSGLTMPASLTETTCLRH